MSFFEDHRHVQDRPFSFLASPMQEQAKPHSVMKPMPRPLKTPLFPCSGLHSARTSPQHSIATPDKASPCEVSTTPSRMRQKFGESAVHSGASGKLLCPCSSQRPGYG
eukprot:RCo049795